VLFIIIWTNEITRPNNWLFSTNQVEGGLLRRSKRKTASERTRLDLGDQSFETPETKKTLSVFSVWPSAVKVLTVARDSAIRPYQHLWWEWVLRYRFYVGFPVSEPSQMGRTTFPVPHRKGTFKWSRQSLFSTISNHKKTAPRTRGHQQHRWSAKQYHSGPLMTRSTSREYKSKWSNELKDTQVKRLDKNQDLSEYLNWYHL